MRNAVLSAVLGLLPLLAASASAQSTALLSSRTFNGPGDGDDEFFAAVAADGGGYYLAGQSSSAANGVDIWVAKVDASLNLVSSATLDGGVGGFDAAYGVAVGTDGSVFAVGAASSSPVGLQLWLGKFTPGLALTSSVTVTYGFSDTNTSLDAVVVEPDGNLLVVGDVNVTGGSTGSHVWLARYDPSLAILSSASFTNGFASEAGDTLLRAPNGDIFVGGGVAPAALTSHDLWLGKFDASLVLQASATFAGTHSDMARGLVLGTNGDLYVAGIMNNSGTTVDAWLGRYTTGLARISSYSIVGVASSNDSAQAIALGPAGTLVAAGSLSQSGQDENLMLAEVHENDLSVKSTGTVSSAGTGTDVGHAVVVDTAAGRALLAGRIAGTGRDAWLGLFAVSAPALQSIAVTPSTSLALGATAQLTATGTLGGGSTVSAQGYAWSSGAPSVATVTASGLVRALSPGTAVITVSSGAVSGQATVTVPGELTLASIAPSSGTNGTNVPVTLAGTYFDGATALTLERLSGPITRSNGPALSVARANHGAVLLDDGRLLVTGGQQGFAVTVTSQVAILDPAAMSWSAGPSMSEARYSHTAIKLRDGRVLVAGGHGSGGSHLTSAEVYDPMTGSWSPTGPLAAGRGGHMSVLLQDGRVLVAGGYNAASISSCEIWDPATGAWSAASAMIDARTNGVLQRLDDGRVLAAGGDSNAPGYHNAAEVYDPDTNAWSAVNPMSMRRAFPAAFKLADGRVLVAGGVGTSPSYPLRAEIFDPAGGTWTQTSSMSVGGYGQGFAFVDGRPTVFGGQNAAALSRVESYDLATDSWRDLPALSTPGVYLSVTRLADGRFVAAGGESGSSALTRVDVYSAAGATVAATGENAVSSMSLTASLPLAGAATGYWDVVVRSSEGEARILAGFEVLPPALVSLAPSPASASLVPGSTQPFTAVGTYTDGSTATVSGAIWSSTAPAVATVTASGLVTALAEGSALIVASSGAISGQASVTVAYLPTGSLQVSVSAVSPSSAPTGASQAVTVTGTRFVSTTTLALERLSGTGSWAAGASLWTPVDDGKAARLDDGRVLFVGGINKADASVILSSAALFDPASSSWTAAPPMSATRHGFALAKLDDGRVLVAGGQSTGPVYHASAEVYAPATNLWTPAGVLSRARISPGSVRLADGRVLLAGGYDGVSRADTDLFDPATGSWTARAPMNVARSGPSLVLLDDGRVLATGGNGAAMGSPPVAEAEIYDPAADSWTNVSSMTVARYAHRAAKLPDGRVLVVGGAKGGGMLSSTEIYDPAANAWTAGPAMAAPRYNPGLLPLGGRVIVLGGLIASSATASVEAYDPATNAWTALGSLSTARFQTPFTLLADGRILAPGGEAGASAALSSVELFTVPVTTIVATGVSAPNAATLNATFPLAGAATGYWDVVARGPGEGRLSGGFRVRLPALVSLAVSPSSASLEVGGQQAFAAAGTFDDASTQTFTSLVAWSVDASSVASVSTAGVVTAVAPGAAVVTASTGALSASAVVTVAAFPAPASFVGAALSSTSILWSWTDDAAGELGYRVMSGTVNLSGDLPPDTTTWQQNGLTPNTVYGPYFARVFNSSGTADSNTDSERTRAGKPGGSGVSSFSATAATLTWTLNGNPAGTTAEVHRSTDAAAYALLWSSAATALHDASLIGCTSYYYKVRHLNGDAIASDFDAPVLVRTLDTVPAPPASLTAEAVAGGRVALAWVGSPTEGVTGYRLYSDGGAGVFDFGTPLAVFTSTESSWTTGVLASSAAYAFALRATHRCGVEETAGVSASAASTATLAAVRAAIKHPDSGKRIRGNRVTIMAELTSGTPAQASQVLFQYRTSTSAPWTDVVAANVNHPNPDQAAPYFVHWNVSALASGDYHLRAVARDLNGNDDPAPGSIIVRVVGAASDCDIEEDEVAGEIRKRQSVNNAIVNTVATGGKDASDPLAKIVLPPGAVDTSTATVTVESNPTVSTAPPSGYAAVGAYLRVDLSNGQHNLSNGQTACITLTYPSNVTAPSKLAIHSLDEATGVWSRDFATTVNTSSRTVTGCTPHFSIFAVFQGLATATLLDGVRLYPNPYKPNSGNLDEGRPFSAGDSSSGIIFDNLPEAVTLEIYSISGRRVARFETAASGGTIRWDARNTDGRDAASGGYFAVISSPGLKSTVKKFIIIR